MTQRLGFLPRPFRQTGPGAIWLHAVSVGEILSSVELLKSLRQEFPQTPLFLSTATLAGRSVAVEKLTPYAHGIFFAPVDYVWAVRRVLRTLQPSLVLVAETEIWPNLFREVKRTGASLAILNARISDRAFPRYRRLAWFFRAVLPSVDWVYAQTDEIGKRFIELGSRPERVRTAGNLKYDFAARPAPPDSDVMAFLERLRPKHVWIAASTTAPAGAGDIDEDDAVLAALRELAACHPGLLLILAPRKPERFDVAAQKLDGARIAYIRRSSLPAERSAAPAVLLLDSIGELSGLFSAADVVFMGGTLAKRGGHNILEPALFSKPVIVGPHMENFQAIAAEFRKAGAAIEIASAAELASAVSRLLDEPNTAAAIGARALDCAQTKRGATAKSLELARQLYAASLPRYRPAMPWFPLLWLLSRIWVGGARRREQRARANRRRLDVPVISVGNITMGGTGKTPCVLRLAADLAQSGRRPGILTRGYGRTSPETHLIVPPRAIGRAERTGDEPQLFVRSGLAPVGIGTNRFQTGLALLREFPVDVLLLDDGFQHQQLARAVDLVLIDALNPIAGGEPFPLGRLREPLSALGRADLFLITRSNFGSLSSAIEREIRRWNPKAPVFRAATEPCAWVENSSGQRYPIAEPPFQKAAAFCGLGNPASFRRTLENLGTPMADWLEFKDHHRYRAGEVTRLRGHALAHRADALVTTEKDAVNLCDSCDSLLAPVRLFWLEAKLVIEAEREFLREIERRL